MTGLTPSSCHGNILCIYDNIAILHLSYANKLWMTLVYKISLVASRPGNYITPKVDDHLAPYSYRTTTTFLVLVKEQVRFDETLVQLPKPCRLLV